MECHGGAWVCTWPLRVGGGGWGWRGRSTHLPSHVATSSAAVGASRIYLARKPWHGGASRTRLPVGVEWRRARLPGCCRRRLRPARCAAAAARTALAVSAALAALTLLAALFACAGLATALAAPAAPAAALALAAALAGRRLLRLPHPPWRRVAKEMLRPLAARGSAQRLSVAKVRLASVGPHLQQRGRGSARLRRRGGGARRRLLATHALLLQLIPDGVCGRPVPPALGGHPRVEPLLHSLRHAPLQDGLGGGRFVLPHAHLRGGTPALRLRRLPGLPPGGSTGAAQLLRRRASKEKKIHIERLLLGLCRPMVRCRSLFAKEKPKLRFHSMPGVAHSPRRSCQLLSRPLYTTPPLFSHTAQLTAQSLVVFCRFL